MSLDLSGKKGCTTAGTFAAGLTAAPVDADFSTADVMTEANFAYTFLDTSAGDINVIQADLDALTGIAEGDVIVLKKSSTDSNSVTFLDADGVTNNFVNVATEQYCVKKFADGWRLV